MLSWILDGIFFLEKKMQYYWRKWIKVQMKKNIF